MLINIVNLTLFTLVLLSQIISILLLFKLLFFRNNQTKLTNFIIDNAIFLSFVAALIATSGSLFYSEIAHFIPCELCWFQRIFIYPQVILLGMAWWKKDTHIIDYSLALVGVGLLISIYHNYIYYSAKTSNFCSIIAPCTQKYVVGFGYITIPLMALSVLVLIGLLLISKKFSKN